MPWVLKDRLADRGSSHSVRCGAVVCKIQNSTQFLNEIHMQISSSLIRGAGSGLLLRPTPPGRQEVTIPQGAYMCFFANRTHAPERPSSDYELGSTRRGGAACWGGCLRSPGVRWPKHRPIHKSGWTARRDQGPGG